MRGQSRRRSICTGWCTAVALLLTLSVQVHASAAAVEQVEIGFAGQWKVGHWTPVRVTLDLDEPVTGQIVVTVPDGDGVPVRIVGAPVSLSKGESTIDVVAKFGRASSPLQVSVESDAGVVVSRSFTAEEIPQGLLSTQELVVLIGGPEEFSIPNPSRHELERTTVARLDDFSMLPQEPLAFDTVDSIVVLTSQGTSYANLSGDSATLRAINAWIRVGGRMVFSAGTNAQAVLSEGAPLARFAPGPFVEMASFRQTTVLESYAETSDPLPVTGSRAASSLRVPRLSPVDGKIEAFEGTSAAPLPIIVRSTRGFGQIVFVGLDLDQPLIADWPARGRFINRLLGRPAGLRQGQEETRQGQVTHVGYTDLAGQLRSALDVFPRVSATPFWQIAAILVIYILLIGPADYFFLRWLNKPELTWVTFPLLIVLFSLGAAAWAWRSKGTELQLNQVDVIDVDLTATSAAQPALQRSTSWMTLFSPQATRYDLHLAGDARGENKQSVLSWMGLPGAALGGMDAGASLQTASSEPYTLKLDTAELAQVPVANWSTASFTARSTNSTSNPKVSGTLTTERLQPDVLLGAILNDYERPLENCYLFYDRWVFPLGTIQPGSTTRLTRQSQGRTAETFLTQRRIGAGSDAVRVYETAGTDLTRIMQMILFHRAAGGQRYTQLFNRYEQDLDLSSHLTAGRAILFATGGPKGSQFEISGHEIAAENRQQTTLYRFVLPVRVED